MTNIARIPYRTVTQITLIRTTAAHVAECCYPQLLALAVRWLGVAVRMLRKVQGSIGPRSDKPFKFGAR